MRTRVLVVATAMLATSAARAEDAAPASGKKPPDQMQGFISHGDSGDVMEDFFGSRVERPPSEVTTGSRKYDPAIRWDDRPVRR